METPIICKPGAVRPEQPAAIRCEAPDEELCLADLLNALIYEMAVRGMLFSRFEIEIMSNVLTATAWGETVDRLRHQPAVEVKGVSYIELKPFEGRARTLGRPVRGRRMIVGRVVAGEGQS
jgi:SHS2 domain-containing protein